MIKTILTGVSMAGDSECFIEARYEVYGRLRKQDVVLGQLMRWVESVARQDVGLVLCQKVRECFR